MSESVALVEPFLNGHAREVYGSVDAMTCMTPEQQQIAITKACGWKFIMYRDGAWGFEKPCADGRIQHACSPPDYLNDLNAMHGAEKVLSVKQQETYMANLHIYGSCDYKKREWCDLVHATAAQRAEAFLRTLGLWSETETV